MDQGDLEFIVSDEVPKLDQLLSHRPLGRVLRPEDIGAEFALIRRAFEAADKRVPMAEDFAAVGRGSGTHLLKLASSRAPTGQDVLRVAPEGANRRPDLVPSLDAKKAPATKIVFRPLEVEDYRPKPLAEHILNPDEVSPVVTRGFADAFGEDALGALVEALTTPLPDITRLPAAEFPIVFLPRPGGGDLQATPLAPAEAYLRMREVTEPYFLSHEAGRPVPPRVRWHRQHVSDKPQNISSALGKQRARFLARLPRVLDRFSAELHRYARGGSFPRWHDAAVPDAVAAYADLLERSDAYSNRDIRAGLERRADALVKAARAFIDETVADARTEHPEVRLPDAPPVTTVLLRRGWPRDAFDRARRVLTSDHFKERLARAGER